MTGATILGVAYGRDAKSFDDPYIKLAEEGTKVFSAASVPGAFLGTSHPEWQWQYTVFILTYCECSRQHTHS